MSAPRIGVFLGVALVQMAVQSCTFIDQYGFVGQHSNNRNGGSGSAFDGGPDAAQGGAGGVRESGVPGGDGGSPSGSGGFAGVAGSTGAGGTSGVTSDTPMPCGVCPANTPKCLDADASPRCVQCLESSDCQDATPTCMGNRCICDQTQCNGGTSCVDLNADTNNCGACNHDCLGGKCTAGKCEPSVLVANVGDAALLAVNPLGIYYTGKSMMATITKVNLDGTSPTPIATGQDQPLAMTSNSSSVFWTTNDGGFSGTYEWKSSGKIVSYAPQPGYGIQGVAANDSDVYWVSYENSTLFRAPLDGSSGNSYKVPFVTKLALGANSIYWLQEFGNIGYASLDLSYSSNLVSSSSTDTTKIRGLTANGQYFYWTRDDGQVLQQLMNNQSKTLATGQDAYDIVADVTGVYWTSSTQKGSIVKWDGTTASAIATNQAGVAAVTTDAKAIYWLNTTPGQLMRLAK